MLGFANRTVATARAHAAGHAYVVVGADPSGVAGIKPVDLAVLRPKIVRYVSGAVRWRPEYVFVAGQQILVDDDVDPPQHGDPIYPVRHQLGGHPKGRILVRRPGATDVADDFEIDQLVERVRSGGGGLDISVEPVTTLIERMPAFPDFKELAEFQRAEVLARPRLVRAASTLLASALQEPDRRSREDYEAEVDKYAEAYGRAL